MPTPNLLHAPEIVALARQHVEKAEMLSSAKLCLTDAEMWLARGDYANARVRALKSLAYSIGVLHPDYRKAAAL
jgi:hypothetical protein